MSERSRGSKPPGVPRTAPLNASRAIKEIRAMIPDLEDNKATRSVARKLRAILRMPPKPVTPLDPSDTEDLL